MKYIIVFFVMMFACKNSNIDNRALSNQTDFAKMANNDSNTLQPKDSIDFYMPKAPIPDFIDKSLRRLNFEEMMNVGIKPGFEFDFKVYNEKGEVLKIEEVKKMRYASKKIMEMYVDSKGKVREGLIRPMVDDEKILIMALASKYMSSKKSTNLVK